jgi:hypothetical protein
MNIFSTSHCPIQSAQDLTNIHVSKMAVESCQLLSTAHYVLDGIQVGYKPTHSGHPSSKWTRNSSANYQWLYAHYKALCSEYTFRTGKVHKSSELLSILSSLPKNIKEGGLEPFALCMPEEHKSLLDLVEESINGNCEVCHKGTMKEMSIYDDMDGMLTCDKCGVRIKN